jgi:hypothetical protein
MPDAKTNFSAPERFSGNSTSVRQRASHHPHGHESLEFVRDRSVGFPEVKMTVFISLGYVVFAGGIENGLRY